MWRGQWSRLTAICHSAEIPSSQVEGDNIVSSITTIHISRAPKHGCMQSGVPSPWWCMLGWCVYFSTKACKLLHLYHLQRHTDLNSLATSASFFLSHRAYLFVIHCSNCNSNKMICFPQTDIILYCNCLGCRWGVGVCAILYRQECVPLKKKRRRSLTWQLLLREQEFGIALKLLYRTNHLLFPWDDVLSDVPSPVSQTPPKVCLPKGINS